MTGSPAASAAKLLPAFELRAGFTGRWLVEAGLVVTAITEPAR